MSADLPTTLVRCLNPGDLLNMIEVGEKVERIGWLIDPWMGRSRDLAYSRTHNAEVRSVLTTDAGGAIVHFTNLTSAWYLPMDLVVNLQKP